MAASQDPRINDLLDLAAEPGQPPGLDTGANLRTALAGWLPWLLVVTFAAVGGSATALLLLVALGARP